MPFSITADIFMGDQKKMGKRKKKERQSRDE